MADIPRGKTAQPASDAGVRYRTREPDERDEWADDPPQGAPTPTALMPTAPRTRRVDEQKTALNSSM